MRTGIKVGTALTALLSGLISGTTVADAATAGTASAGGGRDDIMTVLGTGQIKAWQNYKGFADRPFGSAAIVAEGFTADNVWFPDIDGDGKPDIATVLPTGQVKAWRNYKGFADMPFGEAAIIGEGFAADNLKFADIDGDGKDDIITVLPGGEVKSWRNYKGFADMPFGEAAVIGQGFAADNLKFADIDGDGKDDIITVLAGGDVKSWRNYKGFANMPFGEAAVIGKGFSADNLQFVDVDGDGKDDIATVLGTGEVKSWRNYKGFADMPFGEAAIIADGFSKDNLFFADLDGESTGGVTLNDLRAIYGALGDEATIQAGLASLNAEMRNAGITTPARKAAFLATVRNESGFRYNANEGGQTATYKGRGFIQLTGPTNYGSVSSYFGHSFTNSPDDAASLTWSAPIARWYWTVARNINPAADRLDMAAVNVAIGYLANAPEDAERCADFKKALQYFNGSLPGGINCVRGATAASSAEVEAQFARQ